MVDWNWYFAALAQSAAAIVGIFGAFVITKILTNQSGFSEKLNRAKETLNDCRKVVDSVSDSMIEWYNTRVQEEELDTMQYLLDEDDSLTPAQLYDRLNFSPYQERGESIKAITDSSDDRLEKIEREEQEARLRSSMPSGLTIPNNPYESLILDPPTLMQNTTLTNEITRMREFIGAKVVDAKHQIRVARDCLDGVRGNPESSAQITTALVLVAILFYAGVIYPLSFLPVPANGSLSLSFEAFWPLISSLKGMLLLVVSLVFTSILLMFFALNLKLRYPIQTINELEGFTKLSNYSKYFEILEKNTQVVSEPRDS